MRYGAGAILVLGLTLGAQAQDGKDAKKEGGGDKFGKLKGPDAVRKVLSELPKRKGSAIKETSSVVRGQQKTDTNFEGIQRKDLVAVKGDAEIYVRGKDTLVNVGGRFDPPDKLQGEEGGRVDNFKNPQVLLADTGKIANGAALATDEAVDGKDCKVIDLVADEAHLKHLLKEFADQLTAAAERRQQGGGGGGRGLGIGGGLFRLNGDSFDPKTSVSTYKLWVGKEDLNVYRLEWWLTPKLKPNAIPKEFERQAQRLEFQVKVDVLFTKWDEEVAFDIPAVIKTKWGVK